MGESILDHAQPESHHAIRDRVEHFIELLPGSWIYCVLLLQLLGMGRRG